MRLLLKQSCGTQMSGGSQPQKAKVLLCLTPTITPPLSYQHPIYYPSTIHRATTLTFLFALEWIVLGRGDEPRLLLCLGCLAERLKIVDFAPPRHDTCGLRYPGRKAQADPDSQ